LIIIPFEIVWIIQKFDDLFTHLTWFLVDEFPSDIFMPTCFKGIIQSSSWHARKINSVDE